MRRNKFSFSLALFCLICSVAYAQDKVEKFGINNNHELHWRADGTLEKIIAFADKDHVEIVYGKAEDVSVDGKALKKQQSVPHKDDSGVINVAYVYTTPFQLVFGENYQDSKFFSRTYFSNNKVIKVEYSFSRDGKINQTDYHDANQRVARIERDANGDGRIDEVQYFENGKLIRTEKPSVH